MIKFIRQTKVSVSFKIRKQFYRVPGYWLFINRPIRFLANLNISRTLLFLMSLMNGINWILTFTGPWHSSASLRSTSYNLFCNALFLLNLILCCHFCNASRSALTNDLNEIDSSFSALNDNKLIDFILCGSDKFHYKKNRNILISTIKSIIDS